MYLELAVALSEKKACPELAVALSVVEGVTEGIAR